jgi:Ser/Thr protein kinase RdoA (MazF antagonist)
VHKVKWYMGTNLFSSWTLETEETRNKNKALLSGYTEVDPIKGGDSTCLPQPS